MSKFRRQIFYLSGFDPRGAGAYHSLYRTALLRYAEIAGKAPPVLSERSGVSALRADWQVESEDCQADYHFLRWDDIVRARWMRGKWAFLWAVLATYRSFALRCRNWAVWRIAPWSMVAFYYPVALVLVAALGALLLAPWLGWGALPAFPLLAAALFMGLRHWQPGWLLHTFAFNRSLCEDAREDIEQRCADFADEMVRLMDAGAHDEVLLVGHSNGVTLLVMVLDKLPEAYRARLKLVTLGQFLQMVAYHDGGGYMRQMLARLQHLPCPWLDISAMADPACFPLVGPFHGTCENPPQLCVASPRLHTLYAPEHYAPIRRDKLNYHFLYLQCPDRVGPFNYARMTAYAGTLESQIAAIQEGAYAG